MPFTGLLLLRRAETTTIHGMRTGEMPITGMYGTAESRLRSIASSISGTCRSLDSSLSPA